jgi:hypothetical protein
MVKSHTLHEQDHVRTAPFIHKVSQIEEDAAEHVASFIFSLYHGKLERYWLTETTRFAPLSKLMMYVAASEYWIQEVGFDPLVHQSQLCVERGQKESADAFKRRQHNLMKSKVDRCHNLLSKAISEAMGKTEVSDFALSLTYLLRRTLEIPAAKLNISSLIEQIPKLIPTYDMLRRLGRIPDSRILEFKSIFHCSEWEIVLSSQTSKLEKELKEMGRTPFSFSTVSTHIVRLKEKGVRPISFNSFSNLEV